MLGGFEVLLPYWLIFYMEIEIMIENVVCLLKFGKRKHIEKFASGILHCSNAKTFWKIEEDKKIKGQGDLLEAGSRIHAQQLVVKEIGMDGIITTAGKSNVLVHAESAAEIPVFCLFAVYKDDCVIDDKGDFQICLSEEKKQTIQEHFPEADTVAIIKNVDEFLNDVEKSIGHQIKHELVHYFNIDKGYEVNHGQDIANDIEYYKYVTQDTPPQKVGKYTRVVFNSDYAYRVLFCKDVFFCGEQEYRILLPFEKINGSKDYPFTRSVEIEVKNIDEFFK